MRTLLEEGGMALAVTPEANASSGGAAGPLWWVSECHGVWYSLAVMLPSLAFVGFLAWQARRSFRRLSYGRSHVVVVAYYALLWAVAVLNLLWCFLQAWQCMPDRAFSWNVLSLFTKSGMLFLEVSLIAFLLQGNDASGFESLARTFVISGAVVAADVLLKTIYVFGFGVPLFIDAYQGTGGKWGLWILHKLVLTGVYGLIVFMHHSRWRDRLPAKPAYYNYVCAPLRTRLNPLLPVGASTRLLRRRRRTNRSGAAMKKIFGAKKDKGPPPSIQDATERINKRGETVDEKIKKLDEELARYKDQIRKTRPGPSQEAIKARAIRLLKHKRMYEEQRNMLYNQTYNLDQVSFAADGLKDAQQTMNAMKAANKELKGMMKTVKIEDIDNMQDEMTDLMDVSNEIQETLGRSYNIPDDVDEEELMGELDALESDMEFESAAVPSYLQPETDFDADLNLPAAPTRPAAVPAGGQEDELGLPAVPRASLRS